MSGRWGRSSEVKCGWDQLGGPLSDVSRAEKLDMDEGRC